MPTQQQLNEILSTLPNVGLLVHLAFRQPCYNKGMDKINCFYCGSVFVPRSKTSKYCSRQCQWNSQKSKVLVSCKECGVDFLSVPSNIKRGNASFCSALCRDNANKKRIGELSPNWKNAKFVRTCEVCGTKFEAYQSSVKRGHSRFCSPDCQYKGLSSENSVLWTGGNVDVACTECGKSISVKRYKLDTTANLFCSRFCSGAWQSKHVRGDDLFPSIGGNTRNCETCKMEFLVTKKSKRRFCSPNCMARARKQNGSDNGNWRGGKSFEPYPITFNAKFKRLVRERDSNTCQVCMKFGNCVHHINYVKFDTNPSNCITLCRVCHSTTNGNRDYWQSVLSPIAIELEEIRINANASAS